MSWQWSTVRLILAGALLGALVIIVAVGTFSPHWRVCEGPTAAQVCRPLALSDPFVVLMFLFVLGIGFPDIAWLEVGPDGVKMKREPGLSPKADLKQREKQEVPGNVREWESEIIEGEGETDGGEGASPRA